MLRALIQSAGLLTAILLISSPCMAGRLNVLDAFSTINDRGPCPVDSVNEFIDNSQLPGSPGKSIKKVDKLDLHVRLLTPINSDTSVPGDAIRAVIDQPIEGPLAAVLPVGTMIEGYVEGARPNARLKQDGQLFIRFYWARLGDRRYDLSLLPGTADGALHPLEGHKKWTKKQKLRGLLMLATRVAVPAALGTGGMSLAITTGAGAVIGGLLADDKKYLQGAVRGAWEGAGLTMFDPVVCKGRTISLPWGTPLELRLAEPAELVICPSELSPYRQVPADNGCLSANSLDTRLSTSARVLKSSAAHKTESRSNGAASPAMSASEALGKAQVLIDEKNLAAALQIVEQACTTNVDDQRLTKMHHEILDYVSGGTGH